MDNEKRYYIIYADPPWQYFNGGVVGNKNATFQGGVNYEYPVMTTQEICALDVPTFENAVCYLWATAPKLPEALQVLSAWGFTYKTHCIWSKGSLGLGYWFRGQHGIIACRRKRKIRAAGFF